MIFPKANFIDLSKSMRNKSLERARHAYLGEKTIKLVKLVKNKNSSCDDRKLYLTNRKKSLNKSQSLKRALTNRLQSITSRKLTKDKSKKSLNSWSKTCLTLDNQSKDDQRKRNKQGENCRIVLMTNGKTQNQHFITVNETSDVSKYLARAFPNNYFITVPRQIDLELMIGQSGIQGHFLNGQTLYLKPQTPQQCSEQVGMQNFQIIKQIGSGGFSKVFLCKSKIDNNFYAMKLIQKEMVIKNKKKKIVMNERNIMAQSSHPFIIDLKHAFESEKYLVFVLEYCAGGELFSLIKKYRRLNEEIARFYIIEILLGLAYLHSKKIVYRDIKPENILIGIDGHVKIADLGLAKPNMDEGELAYSFCGSPQYMSPQMIMQVGHTFPVDYYCLGAMLYELLTGLPPFYSQDPEEIYEAVLVEEIIFPQDACLTNECKSLLKSLLCKDPKQRLGSLYGIKQILAHPWFGKQKYDHYISKKVQPPTTFKSMQKLNLEITENDRSKESFQRVLKDQRSQKKEFKFIMKNFYFDYLQIAPQKQNILINSPRIVLSAKQKQNVDSLKRTKKKMSGALLAKNLMQNMFQKQK